MITHVDYDAYIWWNNMPNTKGNYYDENENVYYNDHQRFTIFRAGKSTSDYGVTSDLYPYNTNNSLTATSNPAATLYNKNSDGTKYMHIDITDISVASDGTASLTFSKADRSSGGTDPDTPVTPSGSVLLYESFDKCGGTGGNDNQWSGNGVAGSVALSMEFDNNGWTSSNKIFLAINVYDWATAVRLAILLLLPFPSMALLICHSRQEGGTALMMPPP